jgi:hypothetical protein
MTVLHTITMAGTVVLLVLALIAVLLVAAARHPSSRLAALGGAIAVALAVALAVVLVGGPRRNPRAALGGAKAASAPAKAQASAAALRRGEEVDAAAAEPPTAFLGSPEISALGYKWTAFDLDGGRVVPTRAGDGIYFGGGSRDDPGRATLLTPWALQQAVWDTSGRKYAWWVLASPEARYAVRAASRGGRIAKFDPERLIAWLRPRLLGVPPHKLALADYLAHLRGLGVVVAADGAVPGTEVRFNLIDMMTEAERAAAARALTELNETDFAALDWSAYDATVGRAACKVVAEVSGDVVVDLDARAVTAPKTRTGLLYASVPHSRSFVTFHTHPAARYRGAKHEPPSDGDLVHIMVGAAFRGLVWHFITAPEGTYIVRPSQLLLDRFRADPSATETRVIEAYMRSYCVGGVAQCAVRATDALHDAGFVAYFRSAPCMPLSVAPDLLPDANAHARREVVADLKAHAGLPGATLLAADWARALDAGHTSAFRDSSWMRARFVGGAIQPMDGHGFGDPADPSAYPIWAPGPLMIFCVADDAFPAKIPAAAVRVAQEKADVWAWVAFLSSSRVLVFRADAAGALEMHGPRRFAPEQSVPH